LQTLNHLEELISSNDDKMDYLFVK